MPTINHSRYSTYTHAHHSLFWFCTIASLIAERILLLTLVYKYLQHSANVVSYKQTDHAVSTDVHVCINS